MSNLSCFKKDILTVKIKFEAPTDFTELANWCFREEQSLLLLTLYKDLMKGNVVLVKVNRMYNIFEKSAS